MGSLYRDEKKRDDSSSRSSRFTEGQIGFKPTFWDLNEKTFRSKSQSFSFGIQTALALNLQEKYGILVLSFGGKVRHHRTVVLPTPYRTGKRKTEEIIPMYTTKKVKCDKTPELDMLAHESGRVYSKVVSLLWKVKREKGFWLSQGAVQKYIRLRGYNLHSQTIQAIIQSYFDSLKSYFRAVKSNPDAKPPKRTPHFYKVRWIQNGITFKDGVIRLSNGKGNVPITLKSDVKPVYVEMYFQRGSYYFSLVYKVQIPPKRETGKVVAIDMGEIHPIVSHDGQQTIIYNGRVVRAIKQYLNKFKAYIQSKMDRCIKRSNRWYHLKRIKTKILAKLNAQLKDAEHKITSRFISDCIQAKADTIVIGDLKGIRKRAKFGKVSNQKVHQWAFDRLQSMICYKAELAGLKVKFVSEAYTSQTCPRCGNRKKHTNRNYHCSHCGFEYHRDGVGAINLWNKVSGFMLSPVVGAMASPIGVRFDWHLCKSG